MGQIYCKCFALSNLCPIFVIQKSNNNGGGRFRQIFKNTTYEK